MEVSLLQNILLIVVLIFVNAFFAATEIAVLSLNSAKLKRMAEEGDRAAARMIPMVEEPSSFLSTIQIGITLAGFLASAFAAENFSDPLVKWIMEDLGFQLLSPGVLDGISVVVITMILSYFTLVFGELVPKRIAMQKSMEIARLASPMILAISVIMRPVIWLLSASTNGILRLLRMKTDSEDEPVTEEEIRFMIDLGEEKGTIKPKEREMIENIFELNDVVARDIMTHRKTVEALSLDDSPEELFHQIEESGWSRFPVYRGSINEIEGILMAKEFLVSYNRGSVDLKSLLRKAYFVPETVKVDELFHDMQKKKLHIAVVVDEYGETSGIVTMEDLLEEIVGNIYDESDEGDELELAKVGENLWRAAGSVEISQLSKELEMNLPEEREFHTLGGLVFSAIPRIPEDGSRFEVKIWGLKIQVEQMADRRVEWAYVSKIEENGAGQKG